MIQGKKISVMLVFVCQPYLAVMMKENYLKFWKDEVDEVLINVNGRNKQIMDFIVNFWKDDDKVAFIDTVEEERRQGDMFDRLYPNVKGDILITLDSDNFIYKKGVITIFTGRLIDGTYDCIGSLGHHAYPGEIMELCLQKYGIVRLNPFMSFWKKEVIDKMDKITFRTYNYLEGEEFKPLGKMPKKGWMDAMARLTLQYLAIAKNYLLIPSTKEGEYLHMSGISSIFRRSFRSLEDTDTQKFNDKPGVKQHISYWVNYYLLYEMTKDKVPAEFNKEYERAFDAQLKVAQIPLDFVKSEAERFKKQHKGLFV